MLAPKISGRKGEYSDLFDKAKKNGFLRVRVNGQQLPLDEPIALDKKRKHNIEIVVDRLVVRPDIRCSRLADSVDNRPGRGRRQMLIAEAVKEKGKSQRWRVFFLRAFVLPRLRYHHSPKWNQTLFSFNAPSGACPACRAWVPAPIDPEKVIPAPEISINDGAVAPWGALGDETRQAWHVEYRREVLKKLGVNLDKPRNKLTKKQQEIVLFGSEKRVKVPWSTTNGEGSFNTQFDGVINYLERPCAKPKMKSAAIA